MLTTAHWRSLENERELYSPNHESQHSYRGQKYMVKDRFILVL